MSASNADTADNSMVAENRSQINSSTGRRWRYEWPKLPRAALPMKRVNCTTTLSFKPSRSFNASRSSSEVSCPVMLLTGSPTN